jgi:hypothetical protein
MNVTAIAIANTTSFTVRFSSGAFDALPKSAVSRRFGQRTYAARIALKELRLAERGPKLLPALVRPEPFRRNTRQFGAALAVSSAFITGMV